MLFVRLPVLKDGQLSVRYFSAHMLSIIMSNRIEIDLDSLTDYFACPSFTRSLYVRNRLPDVYVFPIAIFYIFLRRKMKIHVSYNPLTC